MATFKAKAKALISKQEGQDGPGRLTLNFEGTITNLFSFLAVSEEKNYEAPFTRAMWNYFKIGPVVSEKIFHEFPHVPLVQIAPIHQSYFYQRIKISQKNFEKGHPRNIPVKLFQNLASGSRVIDF